MNLASASKVSSCYFRFFLYSFRLSSFFLFLFASSSTRRVLLLPNKIWFFLIYRGYFTVRFKGKQPRHCFTLNSVHKYIILLWIWNCYYCWQDVLHVFISYLLFKPFYIFACTFYASITNLRDNIRLI